MTLLWIVLGLIFALVAVSLAWRCASRRASLPCPTWLAWLLEGGFVDRLIGTEVTLDRIGLRPGQHVLEVGPGPGRLLIPAARRVLPGGKAVGIDIQPGMVQRLVSRAARAGATNLTAIVGDAAKPHLADASFDLVFLCSVLGEIPDRLKSLRQCYRALKPGGILSITEFFSDPHFQRQRTVMRLAEAAGFRPRELHGRWYFYTANFTKE